MICSECGHKLPDDSEFCQYCGSKIESITNASTKEEPTTAIPKSNNELKLEDNMTQEEVMDAVIEFQAKNTIDAMEANTQTQPNCESDADFGLVPQNPIYTLALKSVDGEKEYLKKLRTESGERIQYTRRGSTSVEGVNGMIDIYDTFLPSGQQYKTIYINMYGARESVKAPIGFTFMQKKAENPHQFGSAPQCLNSPSIPNEQTKSTKIVKNISMILAALSAVLIIVALNLQDVKRNIYESLNPTILYLVLLSVNVVYIALLFISGRDKYSVSNGIGAVAISVVAIVMQIEGTLFSNSYFKDGRYRTYGHANIVSTLNALWFAFSIAILLVNLLPIVKSLLKKWYYSVRYRENCYKRVAKMKDYLEKGIINQEEFEKTRQEILKNIEK